MATERLGKPRARMFVALDPAATTRDALVAWQRELIAVGGEDLRPVARDSLHITLAFLGYQYERDCARIADAVAGATLSGIPLSFEHHLAMRPARRPRLYAAAANQLPELMSTRAQLVERLEALGIYRDERRAFWPHVTLCRVKSSAHHHRAIEHLPGASPELGQATDASSITLYRSELRPAGAVYTVLARTELSKL